MKKSYLVLLFCLVLLVTITGCFQPKPIPGIVIDLEEPADELKPIANINDELEIRKSRILNQVISFYNKGENECNPEVEIKFLYNDKERQLEILQREEQVNSQEEIKIPMRVQVPDDVEVGAYPASIAITCNENVEEKAIFLEITP